MNIIKVLWCRFHQCFGTFTILLVYHIKYPLKWDFLDIYLTMFSESVTSKKQNLWGSSFHSKCLKYNLSFKDAAKYCEKKKIFWDNCIWIDILKLSPLRTGCFSSVANVLTQAVPRFGMSIRETFSNTLSFPVTDEHDQSCDADFNSAWARLPYCSLKHLLKRDFLEIYLTKFSESVTSKIVNLWGSYFYSKCLKFSLDFKNATKKPRKIFLFLR